MQQQNSTGRAISDQNAMQSPLAAQQGLAAPQRASRAGATASEATPLGQIQSKAAATAAAGITGSSAMSQSSSMVLSAAAGQQSLQRIHQRLIPAQQALQATRTGQTPAGSTARQCFTQQPNSQDIFNSSASILNQMPIPSMLAIKQHTPAAVKLSPPCLTGGHAASARVISSPAIVKSRPFELNGSTARVLPKRKVSKLFKDVIGNDVPLLGGDDDDDEWDTNIDGDVEELLLDLADEFVISVASFSCHLAKHRKSNTLDVKDVQLHLERNWNIRIPSYNVDEIRSVRKWNPTQSYLKKLSDVKTNRAISWK